MRPLLGFGLLTALSALRVFGTIHPHIDPPIYPRASALYPPSECDQEFYDIQYQLQVDEFFKSCTVIKSTVYIAHNYTGSFTLPLSVTNAFEITTGSHTDRVIDDYLSTPATPSLTSLIADGLETIQTLRIYNVPSVDLVSFKNLTTVGDTFAFQGLGTATLDFPALKTIATSATLSGKISRYVVEQLRDTKQLWFLLIPISA